MILKLRSYQEDCLQSINDHYQQGINRQLVHLPTAAGKTVIFANLIQRLQRKTLVLAHTCELLDQARDKIEMISPDADVGIVNSEYKEFNHSIVISSIQSARQPFIFYQYKNEGNSLFQSFLKRFRRHVLKKMAKRLHPYWPNQFNRGG